MNISHTLSFHMLYYVKVNNLSKVTYICSFTRSTVQHIHYCKSRNVGMPLKLAKLVISVNIKGP